MLVCTTPAWAGGLSTADKRSLDGTHNSTVGRPCSIQREIQAICDHAKAQAQSSQAVAERQIQKFRAEYTIGLLFDCQFKLPRLGRAYRCDAPVTLRTGTRSKECFWEYGVRELPNEQVRCRGSAGYARVTKEYGIPLADEMLSGCSGPASYSQRTDVSFPFGLAIDLFGRNVEAGCRPVEVPV